DFGPGAARQMHCPHSFSVGPGPPYSPTRKRCPGPRAPWGRRSAVRAGAAAGVFYNQPKKFKLFQHRLGEPSAPLALPDTLDPLVVDYPARLAQELGDLAIAIAAVLPGKLDNIGGETLLVLTTARDLALCRAMLPERRTGATLGDMQLRSDLLNA